MKKSVLSLLMAALLLIGLLAGCGDTDAGKNPEQPKPNQNKPQLTVALNPILVDANNQVTVAYNDVKNAAKEDRAAKTLLTMEQDCGWQWVMRDKTDGWVRRPAYALDKWKNGAGVASDTLYGYGYTADGAVSLAHFAASAQLQGYGSDVLPAAGVLLSLTGAAEEALSYIVPADGVYAIPEGTVTAVQSVGGVKTGFLAEDGTARRGAVRIMVNNTQIFSGSLCNATAAADGVAVSQLSYPTFRDLHLKAGDRLFIAVQLDARANTDADVSVETVWEEGRWVISQRPHQVIKPKDEVTDAISDGSIPLIRDYESTFSVFMPDQISAEEQALITGLSGDMMDTLQALVPLRRPDAPEPEYEIVMGTGVLTGQPGTAAIMEELTARANNANDYIIRLVGNKLYIMGGSVDALRQAVELFMTTFVKDDGGRIPAGYNVKHQPELATITLGGASVGGFTIRTEHYPSYMVQRAAEELQTVLREKTGYLLPVSPLAAAAPHGEKEICIGPMNMAGVKVDRVYDTRFTAGDTAQYMTMPDDGYLDKAESYYEVKLTGDRLVVNGGSSYAVNAAAMLLTEAIKAGQSFAEGFSMTGDYVSDDRSAKYTLTDGYALTWAEEFSYTGVDNAIEAEVKKRWAISDDTTDGPTPQAGGNGWDQQRRPGIYGENWWIHTPANGGSVNPNGYLLEITKKESYGYDAVRLIAKGKWGFRYGIWETRIVMASRNGACSALWTETSAPVQFAGSRNEIDVYENFGRDVFIPNLHTWMDTALANDGHVDHNGCGDMLREEIAPAEGEHFYDTFHYMGMVWTPTRMVFFLDNQLVAETDLTPRRLAAFRTNSGTTIKLANGVGGAKYCEGYNPFDFMGDNVDNFFEVQVIDYTRLYQTDPTGLPELQQSMINFARSYER